MNYVKRKHWLLIGLILLAMLILSGCGAPAGGVQDINAVQPEGFWQTFVVWPLAKALIWLDLLLVSWGVPYSWGFAIILFTLIVKLVTLPLTISQIRGMQAQRELQPKIQELQKKYGNDRNRIAQEQMKLYQEAGVNPLSGCLPLLIQMPILFGLYAALVAIGPYLRNASFFWIPDLAFPTTEIGLSWITDAFRAGDYYTLIAYLILPILLMISQFAMQKWMTPMPTGNDQQGKMTQQITLMMTFMFGFFTLTVPAGLTLYWVTSNLLQMLQQWGMMRYSSTPAPAAVAVSENASTAAALPAKPSAAPVKAEGPTPKAGSAKQPASAKRKGGKG